MEASCEPPLPPHAVLPEGSALKTATTMTMTARAHSHNNVPVAPVLCKGCGAEFPSKNAVFRHLKETDGACLAAADRDDFSQYVIENGGCKREKVVILYGYWIPPSPSPMHAGIDPETTMMMIRNGEDVAQLLLDVMEQLLPAQQRESAAAIVSATTATTMTTIRANRSYGHSARSDILAQEDGTGAITEVLATRLPPLLQQGSSDAAAAAAVQQWMQQMNDALRERLLLLVLGSSSTSNSSSSSNSEKKHNTVEIRVLGRQSMTVSRFNAETDVSHRRVEYLLPADFLFPPDSGADNNDDTGNGDDDTSSRSLQQRVAGHQLPSFTDGVRSLKSVQTAATETSNASSSNNNSNNNGNGDSAAAEDRGTTTTTTPPLRTTTHCERPSAEMLARLTTFKRAMQSLTTHIVDLDPSDAGAVFEKQAHDQKRQRNRAYHNNNNHGNNKHNNSNKTGKEGTKCNNDVESKKEAGVALDNVDASEEANSFVKDKRKVEGQKPGKSTKKKLPVGESKKKEQVLRRKRYHNFTQTVMAHEFLSYRRMDRFYHRATLRFDICEPSFSSQRPENNSTLPPIDNEHRISSSTDDKNHQAQKPLQRPFLALSMSGDLFLTGQVCRAVGLFIALARGVIDDDFVDCVFDETYPHLVPTPPAPTFAMYAGDVFYINIEGKAKAILTPRKIDRYEKGWNDEATIQSVRDWQAVLRENVARSWLDRGVDQDGQLVAEKEWTETVLNPWAERARKQLDDYRCWKRTSTNGNVSDAAAAAAASSMIGDSIVADEPACALSILATTTLPPIESIDPTVPPLFEKVLFYLRQADASGLWPSTTLKRQLVMISNVADDEADNATGGAGATKPLMSSLAIAHLKAKLNNEVRSSAYVFVEGQGGASGSFSLGAMPGGKCVQPKGNTLFPELMKAAFELEVALCPNREPSSTIAVNRNAQFRPHTDSGAGAGQSTSLIVGLGTYSGGELVVEGEKMDIRYKGFEFDGWKERHWTMPFQGERYSLVWFTPKGCEGINFVK